MDTTSITPFHVLDEDDQLFIAETLHVASSMLLLSFARYDCPQRDVIIRNFVARSAMTLKGILALWGISDFQGAWMLHRCLLDRMFHLHSIGENNEFAEFDDWSFYQQYNAQNRVKSDPEFKNQAVGWEYNLSEAQKMRAAELSKNKPSWRRPRAEAVAKQMDMEFLYRYGYDYASTHIHPMANDGQEDFFTITNLPPNQKFPSNIKVLHNSSLATTMIFQDAINFSSFKWKKITWTYLEDVRRALDIGDSSFVNSFKRLEEAFLDEGLCIPDSPDKNINKQLHSKI